MFPIAVMGQCGTSNLTADDGTNTYQTAPIGPHCWTTTNFRATNYYDGTEIPSTFIYKSEMYPDEAANLENYGRLYTWYAAMKVAEGTTAPVTPGEHGFVQGICPDGWHLPLEVEVTQLSNYDAVALHSENPIHWLLPGTNETGQNMLPGGFYSSTFDRYENLRGESYIWTASSLSPTAPKVIWSDCHCSMCVIKDAVATNAMSVRCVYDIYRPQVVTDAWSVEEVDDNDVFYFNGNVTFAGYDEDFVRGFQYGTDPADLSNDWNEAATSEATFRVAIENVTPGTTYYYRAYVTNEFGTVYGVIKSFTGLSDLPAVTTDSASAVTISSAKLHGTVTSMGDYTTANVGFKYGTSETAMNTVTAVEKTSAEPYDIAVTELLSNTTYYYQAFAAENIDTVWGAVKSFTTFPEPVLEMSVTTDSANAITSNSASLFGNVTDLGGNTSVNAGFKYGTSETAMNTKADDAVSATGLYSIDITGLTDNTTYYFKAYAATNATDTVWGAVKSFTTLSELPESGTKDTITFIPNGGMGTMSPMMVAPESNITLTANTFAHAGNWQFTGWNTAADGSGDSFLDEQVLTSEGNLTLYAQWHTWCTGTPNTHINEIGTDRIEYLKDNQNNQYQVIQIGNQCWMRENLRTTKYADATDIEQGSTTSNSVAYWYYPNGNVDNKQTCGLLYNWKAVRNNAEPFVSYPKGMQGVCPTGWHVPSKSEWTQMVDSLRAHSEYGCGNNDKIAKALASPQGWTTNQKSCNVGTEPFTNNAAGFSAIPAGSYTGSYSYFGDRAYFWTSDQNGLNKAFYRSLYSYLDTLYRGAGAAFSNAYSVRCVRDMVTPDGPETENCGTVIDQDGNTYRTVIIGEQCWMRDNLRTLTNNGYGNVYTPTSKQIYGYEAEIYGRLYDWAAVMQGADNSNNVPSGVQGICPTGWHVPSDAEWIEMIDFVKSQSEYRCDANKDTTIAKALASTKGWYNSPNNCTVGHLPSENNAVGFSAIPAGYYSNNILYTAYDQANYATTTKTSSNNEIWCRSFGSNGSKVYHVIGSINKYYSVRCVKN